MNVLLAGYSDVIITPPLGTALWGYGGKGRPAESVLDELKAHAVWLEKGADQMVLISCDLGGFSVEFSDVIRKQIASEHGMPMEHILLSCTHTHSGPAAIQLEGEGIGDVDPEYLAKIPNSVSNAVRAAKADLGKAILRVQCQTIAPIGFNRCNDNFEPIDPELTTAIFERPGRKKIYMFNYACHPVVIGGSTAVSADWPGQLVQAVEKRGHYGVVFQGFCGDINPVNLGARQNSAELSTLYGEFMCQQVLWAEPQAQSMDVTGIIGLEKRVRIPMQVPDLVDGIQKEHKELFIELLEEYKGKPEEPLIRAWVPQARAKAIVKETSIPNVPIQRMALGPLNIIGLPGEVFCEYGLKLKAKCPMLFTIGLAGGEIGYLPTAKAYESKRSFYAQYACYGSPKADTCLPFVPNLEELLLSHCRELLHINR